jgi:hypothetical protein
MDVWKVATTWAFDSWFRCLVPNAQTEVIAKVNLLKILGPALGRPHADTLNGSRHKNMKELRAEACGAVLRIAFAFDPGRSAILLCAGNKAGVGEKRFYKRLIERADDLYEEHLAELKAAKKPGGK